MEHTWLGKKGIVEVTEKYPGAYEASINVDGQAYYIAEIERRSDGKYTAIANGSFFTENSIEQAIMPALKIKEEEAARRIYDIDRVKKNAAARQKAMQLEKEREAAFE